MLYMNVCGEPCVTPIHSSSYSQSIKFSVKSILVVVVVFHLILFIKNLISMNYRQHQCYVRLYYPVIFHLDLLMNLSALYRRHATINYLDT